MQKAFHYSKKSAENAIVLNSHIKQAITSLHLEGINLSNDSLEDLSLFSQGKLSKEEVINRVLSRVSKSK